MRDVRGWTAWTARSALFQIAGSVSLLVGAVACALVLRRTVGAPNSLRLVAEPPRIAVASGEDFSMVRRNGEWRSVGWGQGFAR